MFRRLLRTQSLLAQLEAGANAVAAGDNPNPALANGVKECVEHVQRYKLLEDYMDTLLSEGGETPKILTGLVPETIVL